MNNDAINKSFDITSCYSKKAYTTLEFAQKLANRLNWEGKRKNKLRAYDCFICGKAHITSQGKKNG